MNMFSSIAVKKRGMNKFDLRHDRKLSTNFGKLVPILVKETLPGERIRCNSDVLVRVAPMLAPIMHRVNVFVHYFFVPNRLVWSEWEDFITGGRLGTANPVHPYIEYEESPGFRDFFSVGSIADHIGCPVIEETDPEIVNLLRVSALPFRAYQMIYDEYFRDQNLEASVMDSVTTESGVVANIKLDATCRTRYRAWQKDYFTSALPWAQRGGAVTLPFEVEVNYRKDPGTYVRLSSDDSKGAMDQNFITDSDGVIVKAGTESPMYIDNIESIDSGSVTIADLRRSARLQEWLELNATGGARYVEQIWAHFGVKSSDARMQRPEYLGGGKSPIAISEVLSTFQTETEGIPQGNMSGHGVSLGSSNTFSRRFEEHGYVIGLLSIMPIPAYQQGVPRFLTRFDKLDYPWPEFAQIGEQEIKVKEIWYDPSADTAENEETFGYQSRYSDVKYIPSTVHGDMKTSLDFWHLGRQFAAKPVLNANFVKCDPATLTRIFAVEDDTDKFWCQVFNRMDSIMPLPYYGTPML